MTDIILFQPKCGIWDIMGVRAPLGLLNIAAVPVDKGYDVKIIDQRANKDWKDELKDYLFRGTKIVGLTAMIGEQIKNVLEVFKYIKSIKPEVMTVLGGPLAQTMPGLCIKNKNIDVVCYGEGDYILSDLMEKDIKDVPGIMYGNHKTPPRPLIMNLDELPAVPYQLVDFKNYTAVGFRKGKPSISVVLTRGCPFRCKFCSGVHISQQKWRSYSVERMIKEIKSLDEKYGIKDFYFNDDNIAGNPKHFKEFVNALAENNNDYNWGTAGIRADTIIRLDDETMDNLVASGCKNLDIGVESGSQRVLDLIWKDETLETIEKANKKLAEYDIIVKFTFMGGFPTETEEEFKETLKFRKKLLEANPNATAPIFLYTPFPATELYPLALEEGLKPPETLEGWADFNYNTWCNKYESWLTKKRIKLIENAVFLSYFADKNLSYKYNNPLLKFMFKAYYPIAKFRYDRSFYSLFVEKWGVTLLTKLNEKINIFGRFKK